MNRHIAGAMLLLVVTSVILWHYPLLIRLGVLLLVVISMGWPEILWEYLTREKGTGAIAIGKIEFTFVYTLIRKDGKKVYKCDLDSPEKYLNLEVTSWPEPSWDLDTGFHLLPVSPKQAKLTIEGSTIVFETSQRFVQDQDGDVFEIHEGKFERYLQGKMWQGEIYFSTRHNPTKKKKTKIPLLRSVPRIADFVGI